MAMSNSKKIPFDFQKRFLSNILIYPKFQLSLIGINFLALVVAFAILIFQNFYIFSKLHKMGEDAGLTEDHVFHQFIRFQENQFLFFTTATFIVVLLIITLVSLFISHRVAGPVLRLKTYFLDMQKTEKIQKLEFRKNDFFDDLPKIINSSLQSVVEKNKSKKNGLD